MVKQGGVTSTPEVQELSHGGGTPPDCIAYQQLTARIRDLEDQRTRALRERHGLALDKDTPSAIEYNPRTGKVRSGTLPVVDKSPIAAFSQAFSASSKAPKVERITGSFAHCGGGNKYSKA